ncbi:hypothetical protein SAMN05421741_14917 [Paenimyroides ummariense]|uniref:Uncharacterized protein n=1 Tax=Paenimyroides ummariense TaxID=913024 RepID=A0A1I5GTE7_9FLAO|nr:hypothetical protein [Paenimyroides ummariense]SFO39209.1 hypothetical protein SAMN05421741_14917 [Paenimyroides ummariense]
MSSVLNLKMFSIFVDAIVLKFKIESQLQELLSEGFIEHNGCYLLKTLYKQNQHINKSDFPDSVSYECLINSVHVDDYVDTDFFEQALLFSMKIIEIWNSKYADLRLNLILSQTDFGFNLKFHLHRKNEQWINKNEIDNFEEALIVFSNN